MKKIVVTGTFCFFYLLALAQTDDGKQNYFINAYDVQGAPLKGKPNSVKGSPLLNQNWGTGMVKFKSGQWVKNISLQFNLVSNELYFRNNNETLVFLHPVAEFIMGYEEESKKHAVHFRSGYPAVGSQNENKFYEVLGEGPRIHLLRMITKVESDRNEYGAGGGREYRVIEQYYLFDVASKTMQKIKREISSIKKALPHYAASIAEFTRSRRIKDEDDLLSLVRAINKLP